MESRSPGNRTAECDVLIVGGGPAGSTMAALLAERGKSVVLLEKDRHPRFHVGESLLPFNIPLLEKLGVLDRIERIGMPKFGIEFVSPHHEQPSFLDFSAGWNKEMSYAFQVRRSEFDAILLENAARKGADVVEDCRATAVDFPPEGGVIATATAADGAERRWRARFLVDGSGRDTFLATRLKVKRRHRRHQSAAIFGYFSGAERLPGRAEGNISIFWFDHGWFWFIPLRDGETSVGAVCRPDAFRQRDGDAKDLLERLIRACPALAARLEHATLTGPVVATGNYSYDSARMAGERYLMIGDACGFVDPVFSTGVYLAMHSAFVGADAVMTCLDHPARARGALRRYERDVRRSIERFSWFIYRVTSPVIRDLFMAPRNYLRMEEAVLSLLSGDIAARSPIRSRLVLFKALYYLKSLFVNTGRLVVRSPI